MKMGEEYDENNVIERKEGNRKRKRRVRGRGRGQEKEKEKKIWTKFKFIYL